MALILPPLFPVLLRAVGRLLKKKKKGGGGGVAINVHV